MWYTVPKTSLKRCETVREEQVKVFILATIRVFYLTTKCSAQASPLCQLWHTQSDYLPSVSFAYQSHGSAWKLGDSFFCFPAFSIAPESCMHRIRLFAYVNCWAQNIPSCVLQTYYRLQHTPCCSPGTEQFIASLFPNRASANFIRVMDYVRKYISPIDSLFQRAHYLSHFL